MATYIYIYNNCLSDARIIPADRRVRDECEIALSPKYIQLQLYESVVMIALFEIKWILGRDEKV